ncbi:hypothetical protein ISS98_09500 [Dyella flagellata]
MEQAGLEFRATKDLDVVLHVEVLTPAFGEKFWAFVKAGGYQVRETSTTERRHFYRFQKPTDLKYPAMIELFARKPDLMHPIADGTLTPIPFEDDITSLSAILLDDDYYKFIMDGRVVIDGLPLVKEDRIIALKAAAWMELTQRRNSGEKVDSANVRKHINDVLRLSQLLTPDTSISIQGKILEDMRRFIDAARAEPNLDPKQLTINTTVDTLLDRVAEAYGIA